MQEKRMIVMILCIIMLFFTLPLSAQTVHYVTEGVGTLQQAVWSAADGDILELISSGGIYANADSSKLAINKTLTIRAQEDIEQMPIVRNTYSGTTDARLFEIQAGGNLVLIGLDLDGTIDGTTVHAKNAVRNENVAQVDSFAADYLKIYDCYIHDTTEPFVKGHAYTRLDTIIIKNTILNNCGREAVLLRESEAEGSPDVRYVEFENCTFTNVVREAMYTDFNDPVIRINHCTFDQIGTGDGDRILYLRDAQDAQIKNSIFSNQGAYQDAFRIYGTSTISYCDTFNVGLVDLEESASIGPGMLGEDPLYTDPANMDYTLQEGSPVLGKADDGYAMGDLRWDPTAQGPQVYKVEAGDGTLQQAIWMAKDGEIIELVSGGGLYTNSDSSELAIDKTLTIRAREGLTQMPIVRNTYSGTTSARLFEIQAGGNLVLIGLDLDGTIDGTTVHAKNAVRNENVAQVDSFAADYLKIYDCYIHDMSEPFVKGHAYTRLDTIIIKNTILNNCGREAVLLRESEAEGSPDVRYVEFENCTFTNVVREAMYTDFNDPVIRINHCTFDQIGTGDGDRILYLRDAQDAQIKNSIFSNQGAYQDAFRIYGTSTISYCDTFNVGLVDLEESASIGPGMLGEDPLYNNPAEYDYRLADSSPVRGKADDGYAMGDLRWEVSPGKVRLTVLTEGQGIVTLDPTGGIYDPGTTVTLTANPDPGWKLIGWEGVQTFPPDNPSPSMTVNTDTTVTAIFESLKPKFQFIVNSIGIGHVELSPDTLPGGMYYDGTNVELTAVPDSPTWEFVEWGGDIAGRTENPTVVKVDSAMNIDAIFASTLTQFVLTIEIEGKGSVSLDPEPVITTYDTATVVELTAVADIGWEFDSWSGDLVGVLNPDTVQMDSNITVTAHFKEIALTRRALEVDTTWDLYDAFMFANNNSQVDTILFTTSGGLYTSYNTSDVTVMKPLIVMAAPGLEEKPILTNSDPEATNLDILRVFDDLTLKGVVLDGGVEETHGMKYGIRLRHYTDDSVRVGTDITVMDCEFRNLFENKGPTADGHAFKIDVDVLAGTIRFEGCTFVSLGYEAIRISDIEKWPTDKTLDSLIVRNCTFVDIDAECVRYYSDLDAATPDAPVIIEHLTINNSATRVIYLKNSGGAIVRDIIISNSRQSGHGRDGDLMDAQGNTDVPSFVSHIDTFNVATVPIKSTDGEVDETTIYGFDPMYKDAANLDFTLLAGSPMYGLAHDGTAMGDLRWVDPSVDINDDQLEQLPTTYSLEQNYPNPFNPTTTINFALKQAGHTILKVYDILGREVVTLIDKNMPAGYHKVYFHGSDLATGLYFYRLKSGEFEALKKMLLVK